MVEAGILDEVSSMLDNGYEDWIASSQVIGYAEIARHLRGKLALEEALEIIAKRSRSLARRQMAWFARDPRITWFEVGPEGASGALDRVLEFLQAA
jgi:tRNA dimethylallyltransferase